jgi:plasmid maintenance system antidote protein VapI
MNLADAMRDELRACIARAGISQAEVSRHLGITTKHMSQMLTGKAPISLDMAQDIAVVCGREIRIRSVRRRRASDPAARPSDRN